MTKEILEELLRQENSWAGRSTIILVIGILGEYVLPLFFNENNERRQSRWKRVLSIGCGILVVAGISGEYHFGSRISQTANQIQILSDQEVSKAGERASNADREAARARRDAETTRMSGERLQLDVANANARAERERLARVKIEALLGARHLDRYQKEQIASRLARYSGIAVDVFVLDQEGDPAEEEAINFGMDIVDALGKPMKVSGYAGSHCLSSSVFGVFISAPQDLSKERYAAGDIAQALKAAGVDVVPYVGTPIAVPCSMFSNLSVQQKSSTLAAKIEVIIGKRPTPILK